MIYVLVIAAVAAAWQWVAYRQGVQEGRRRAESDAWWRAQGLPTMDEYQAEEQP